MAGETGEQTPDSGELEGEIRINHSVVVSIIRISAQEVPGVAQVGGSFLGGVAALFSRKDTEHGISVREEEDGRYAIEVRVVLYFGVPLMEVATQIQRSIAQRVFAMTRKAVARVNVVVDGVRTRPCAGEGGEE
ncbi:MAG: Asp23/Gls24 family envelope stress response protein [Puniceicoccales bacterium]|nr:Asp23/Gls24 family envelope stress response protein [Puniceicoccales bacterium]